MTVKDAERKWHVAIIGAGNNAQVHAEGMRRHAGRIDIAALVEPDTKRRTAFAEKFGIERVFDSVQRMLEDSSTQVEAAVVSTPTNVRMEVCNPLFESGIPVLLEKPMCDNLEDAIALESAASRRRCPFSINQNFRFLYPYNRAREVLKSGELGRPLHIVQHELHYREVTGWRAALSRNVMSVMSIHWLDGYRYLLDDEPESVYCRAVSGPSADGNSDTAISLTSVMHGGTLVSLNESFSSYLANTEERHFCSIDCERGGIIIEKNGTLRITRHDMEPTEFENEVIDKPESDFLMLDEFFRCIERNEAAPSSAKDNLKSMRFLEAAYISAARGELVRIDDIPLTKGAAAVAVRPEEGIQPILASRWGIYHKEPGDAHSKVHFHDCDEWYLITEGTGTVRIGDTEIDVQPLDLLHAPAGTLHGTLHSNGTYTLIFMEGPPRGRRRRGHLHVGADEPFIEQPVYLAGG